MTLLVFLFGKILEAISFVLKYLQQTTGYV